MELFADITEPHAAEKSPVEAPPPITALAPWFGSKRTLAPLIVHEAGPHVAWWEVFCGSMAVTLAKPPCAMETVNDLHGDLINLARCIKHPTLGPALYRRLRRWLASSVGLREAADACKTWARGPATDEPDIDRAEVYFATSWMGRNGVAGTQSYNQGFSRRFTKNGGHAAKRWGSAIDSIPAWRRRMRNLSILAEDGLSLLERIEDVPGVAIYCDPPYLVKGAKYVHDFAAGDHAKLANALMRFKRTRVVVSYYDHPDLAGLYPGWTLRRVYQTKALVNQGMRDAKGATVAPEVLLINGPSFAPATAGQEAFRA
jgi:DNA adenine methylase